MAKLEKGVAIRTLRDALDTSGLAIDFLLKTHKLVLVTDSYTPNFDTHSAYADITNELAGTGGYTVTGRILSAGTAAAGDTVPTFALASGVLTYDLTTDVAWPSASFTARGSVLYADALTNNDLMIAQTFGADYTATNGTFTIQLAAGGWMTIDYTP